MLNRLSKHVLLRKNKTAAASARAGAFQHLKHKRMPPLEKVDASTGLGGPAPRWGSEARIRQIATAAGATLWDMPRDDDFAFHMYAR